MTGPKDKLCIVLALRYNSVGRLFIAKSELYPLAAASVLPGQATRVLLKLAKLFKRTFWRWTGNVEQLVMSPQTGQNAVSLWSLVNCIVAGNIMNGPAGWLDSSKCWGHGVITREGQYRSVKQTKVSTISYFILIDKLSLFFRLKSG